MNDHFDYFLAFVVFTGMQTLFCGLGMAAWLHDLIGDMRTGRLVVIVAGVATALFNLYVMMGVGAALGFHYLA